MENLFNNFYRWYLSIGNQYDVDPIVFGLIYLGAIPLFLFSVGWIIRNRRSQKPIVVPVILAGFFFLSSYLYIMIDGENIPWWIYMIIFGWIGYCGYVTIQQVKARIIQKEDQITNQKN